MLIDNHFNLRELRFFGFENKKKLFFKYLIINSKLIQIKLKI